MNRRPSIPAEPLRSIPEAAEFLGVSESWLRHEVAARRVPHVRIGRRVLFSTANLAQIVEAHTVEPGPSAAAAVLRQRSKQPA